MDLNHSPKSLLRAVLSNHYTQAELRDFVQLCYFLALPLVRKRVSQGRVNLNLLGLQEKDVVYDCIADLFLRNENGELPKIRAYLASSSVDIEQSTDERVLAELRRLVFGKVHNNLIRLLGEVDPGLGKILRNVRLTLDISDSFVEMHRFGEAYIVSNRVKPLMSLPPMPYALLEQGFSSIASPRLDVPDLLNALWKFLSSQVEHQRAVPIITVALLFKGIYQRSFRVEMEQQPVTETGDLREKILDLIPILCRESHQALRTTYVTRGKTSSDNYDKYFAAVEEVLIDKVKCTGDGMTYFEYLKRLFPEMTRAEYQKKHKQIFEYLVRIGKARIQKELKEW